MSLSFITSSEGDDMPGWQPNWSDVEFDHAAAGAYAYACEQGAHTLHTWVAEREGAARHAVEGWEGPHRMSFDKRLNSLHDYARMQAVALGEDAADARVASATASFEQRRRIELREQWHRESAIEQEQARLADEAARQAIEQAARRAATEQAVPVPLGNAR